MRTSSKSIFSRGAFFALVSSMALGVSGAAVAQSPERPAWATPDAPPMPHARTTHLRVPDVRTIDPQDVRALDLDSGESLTADERFAQGVGTARSSAQNGDDYSVIGMFSRLHGKYMQDRRRFEPNVDVFGGYQAKAGLSGETGSFEFYEVGARADAEMPVDPDTFLIYGGLFTMRRYDMDLATLVPDTRLYEAFLTMGIGRFVNEDFLVEGRFRPGLASDLDGTLNRDDWKFYGDVLATYRTNEQLYWKLGVRADSVFEGTPVYPELGVSYLINENWRVDILAPLYGELAYMPDPSLILKAGLSLQGEEYHYRIEQPGGNDVQADWRTQEFRIYGDATWRLTDQVSLHARAGATLAGKYVIGRGPGVPAYDGQIDPVFFGEIGGSFTF